MEEFFSVILSFPTIVFTVILGVVMLYWLTVIVGFVDMDLFDGGVNVDIDVPSDIDADIDLDADIDGNVDADSTGQSHGPIGSFLLWLGITDIPITIVASFVVLWSWFLSLLLSGLVINKLFSGILYPVISVVAIFICFIASLFLTKFCLWPILPFFSNENHSRGNRDIVGDLCKVESGRVDDKFGQARYTEKGSDLFLNVRNYSGSKISKGQIVLITGYDKETDVYRVDPYEQNSDLMDIASR